MRELTFTETLILFVLLGENPYSGLWLVLDDWICNGHTISTKKSRQLYQVVFDGHYEYIGGNTTINYKGINYKPIEYIKVLLKEDTRR